MTYSQRPPTTAPRATLPAVLGARAASTPDRVVHMFFGEGGDQERILTYARLDEQARAVAVRLLADARPGDRALLLYPPGLDFTVAFWGCLYAGLVAVPVAPPRMRKADEGFARLAAIAANCTAGFLLTTGAALESVGGRATVASAFGGLAAIATDQVDPDRAGGWTPPAADGESIAYLQYSSGSTGMPKGVALPHRSVLANAGVIGRVARLGSWQRGVSWLPTFHDMGLLSGVILPVVHDFPLRQMAPLDFVRRPLEWLRAISDSRATISVAPNFAYELCVRRVTPAQAAGLDLSQWQVALCGAEPIRTRTLREFAERFGPAGFRSEAFLPCYGLAEATLMVSGGPFMGGVTTLRVSAPALAKGRVEPVTAPDAAGRHELAASGELVDQLPIVVVDPDSLEPLPPDSVGEIVVRGESIGAGYWNSPVETAETFGVHVPGVGGGHLRTGDLGFVHEDRLYVTGRRKDLVIVDGSNHYPHDIEAVAAAVHPALRPSGCAVFQLVEPEGSTLVLVAEVDRAYTVVTDGAAGMDGCTVSAEELEAGLRGAISREFSLRLDDVVLVKQGTIPLTTSGKLQRFALARSYREGGLEARRPAPAC
jgi:acyl-CoA synthetase (AMP-forming)/AMP-acid ligase II